MAITRKYTTERECAELMVAEDWERVQSRWFLCNPDAEILFEGIRDEEDEYMDGEPADEFGSTHCPMWGTWFHPAGQWQEEWLCEHAEEVARLGFTIIRVWLDGCEDLFIGIDGAGYSFYEEHWIPLYRLCGFRWHEGEVA